MDARSKAQRLCRGWAVLAALCMLAPAQERAQAEGSGEWWSGFAPPPAGKGLNWYAFDAVAYGDRLVVGGMFTRAGNNTLARYVAGFSGTGWTALQAGMNDWVGALAVVGDDLFVGGGFQMASGAPASRIAKWNGSTWSPLGVGVDDAVSALGRYGSDLIAGGDFGQAGGAPAAHLARWDGATWFPLGAGIDGPGVVVEAIAEFAGHLYVGGYFTSAGGAPVTHLARWDGASWSAFGTALTARDWGWASPVEVLTIAHNGNLLVGGEFSHINGIYCNGLAEWDGVTWIPRGIGLEDGAQVLGVTSYRGDLVAFGFLQVPGGSSMVGRWNGSSWGSLGTGLSTYDNFGGGGALAVFGGDLYVVGNIGTAGGQLSAFIARWIEPDPTGALVPDAGARRWSVRSLGTPSRGAVGLEFVVPHVAQVEADVVDACGRLVRRLAVGRLGEGTHRLTWDATNEGGDRVPAGVYFIRLTADEEAKAGAKVVLVR